MNEILVNKGIFLEGFLSAVMAEQEAKERGVEVCVPLEEQFTSCREEHRFALKTWEENTQMGRSRCRLTEPEA